MSEQEKDAFERTEYRRLISWSTRLEREAPLLRRVLSMAAAPSLLDLGCGSGEHSAFAAAEGFAATGVDRSEAQIESAKELVAEGQGSLRFLQCDFSQLMDRIEKPLGAAICLGNVLPFLTEEELDDGMRQWHAILLPGAPLLLQWLNYEHFRAHGIRHMPLTFSAGDEPGDELALIRLFGFPDEQHVRFTPTTLEIPADTDAEPRLRRARSVLLRAWSKDDIQSRLSAVGFDEFQIYGGVSDETFHAKNSKDVVLLARRA